MHAIVPWPEEESILTSIPHYDSPAASCPSFFVAPFPSWATSICTLLLCVAVGMMTKAGGKQALACTEFSSNTLSSSTEAYFDRFSRALACSFSSKGTTLVLLFILIERLWGQPQGCSFRSRRSRSCGHSTGRGCWACKRMPMLVFGILPVLIARHNPEVLIAHHACSADSTTVQADSRSSGWIDWSSCRTSKL